MAHGNKPTSVNPGRVIQNIYSDDAEVIRTGIAGMSWTPIGDLSTAKQLPCPNCPVMIYNSDTVVHYVAFGATAPTAPTSPTNGIPIPAGQTVVLNSGPSNVYVISDNVASKTYGYTASH